MPQPQDAVLALVIDTIRSVIDEDWIHDFEIDAGTRFSDDLELESVEFVKIVNALQAHYGTRLDVVGWLSGKPIQELVRLGVGDLVDFIAGAVDAPDA